MCSLTVGVFGHLEIISPTDLDKRLVYTQRILIGAALKKYREVLMTCKQSAKELADDEWTLGNMNGLSPEDFWNWVKTDTTGYDRHPYLAIDKCINIERELWLDLGKCVWRNHWSVYQDHMKYVCNNILKSFKVKILCYAKRVHEMHDLAKYLPTPSMKGEIAMAANWSIHNKEFMNSDILITIKDGLPKSMRDELDDHTEDYCSLIYEDWFELLSTIEVKDESKRSSVHIKKIASARSASLSDRNESVRIPRKKKAKTGVLRSKNPQEGRTIGTMVYCITLWFAKSHECLNASTCCIVPNILIAGAPNVPSKMGWNYLLGVGLILCNSIRSLTTNERRSYNISRSKTRRYIALQRNTSRAVK